MEQDTNAELLKIEAEMLKKELNMREVQVKKTLEQLNILQDDADEEKKWSKRLILVLSTLVIPLMFLAGMSMQRMIVGYPGNIENRTESAIAFVVFVTLLILPLAWFLGGGDRKPQAGSPANIQLQIQKFEGLLTEININQNRIETAHKVLTE